MKIYNMEQRSLEWFKARDLKMTGSKAKTISVAGVGLESYIYKLVAEHFSMGIPKELNTPDIRHGREFEPEARSIYELKTGNKVEEVGFIERDKYTGCSPDGLVEKDGGVEFKCQDDATYFRTLIDSRIEEEHLWQMQYCLLMTGREWWDYGVYNSNFEKDMFIIRVYPDKEKFKKLEAGIIKGRILIESLIDKYNKYGNTKI